MSIDNTSSVSSQPGVNETPGLTIMADDKTKDIYIALMGVTGTGKSTFIARCTGQQAVVGDSLQSCPSSTFHPQEISG